MVVQQGYEVTHESDVMEIVSLVESSAFGSERLNMFELKMSILGKHIEVLLDAKSRIYRTVDQLRYGVVFMSLSQYDAERAMFILETGIALLDEYIKLLKKYGHPLLVPLK